MKNKLIIKFIIPYLVAGVISFFIVSIMGEHQAFTYALNQNKVTLHEEASTIGNTYAADYYGGDLSVESLQKQLKTVSSYLHCDVYLFSSNWNLLISTKQDDNYSVVDFDPTDYGAGYSRVDNFYDVYNENVVSSYASVGATTNNNYTTMGYVVLAKTVSTVQREARGAFNFNYITLLICYVLGAAFLPIYYFTVSKPLNRITHTTSEYAKGKFSQKINIHSNDEIGQLAESLDYMAGEIESLNEYQKKFIANVSHDFRSPLTSIKGYLEAMLDGTIPPQMQEKYLNIVISETERLTKLTNNLLTMNNVTQQGMILDRSDFDIIALIKHVIETFEGTCAKKRIQFKLIFSDKEAYVNADQQKINQVLFNLIDNAIKFSNAESSILVSVTKKGEKAIISVKDFGIGIPKDSVNKIWERFYKTDLSRGKDKKGTGLGLSIVKEILSAHDEYIDVISTEGIGTEFIFALPKAKDSERLGDSLLG